MLGGLTEKQAGDSDTNFQGTIVQKIFHKKFGENWETLSVEMPKPRTNFEVVLNNESLFIFAGHSGGKAASTQIDIFNLKTRTFSQAEYRLPLGVVGASMTWHGDDVLMIGGQRAG